MLIDPPQVVMSEPAETAVIRIVVPRDEMQSVMGPAFGEILRVVADQGIGPDGPMYAHHTRMNVNIFEFAIGVPVREAVRPVGRVERGEIPAVSVVRSIYRGPYERLSRAWAEMDAWVRESGRTPRPDLWERYLRGPESGDDPWLWETELNRPLIS